MRALVCGISGQDGTYLARWLVDRGYTVIGTSRDAATMPRARLATMGVGELPVLSMNPADPDSVRRAVEQSSPDEIYNLAGQSSVGRSFEHPQDTVQSITLGTLNLLEVLRHDARRVRLFNAGSGDCYGDTGSLAADEHTPLRPGNPYAVAKAAAQWLVAQYREQYGVHACTGILFNHESPLRAHSFVTRKVALAAARIAGGSRESLALGNLAVVRDWGWAPEYVEAMWLMLQLEEPRDLVIASGNSHTLEAFVARMFAAVGLDWRAHVQFDASLTRPSDHLQSRANPARIAELTGWRARSSLAQIAQQLVQAAANANPQQA